ncbi:hypothetical protein QUA06_11365, partial [Microcoleus sp. POL8_C6]
LSFLCAVLISMVNFPLDVFAKLRCTPYLKVLFEAKNTTYSKTRPGDVLKPFYLEQLLTRIQLQPEQLTTFRHFINFCNIVKSKLPN